MSEESYIVNEGKNEVIQVDGVSYQRLAIRTHVITDKDDVCQVIEKYAKPYAQPDDIVFMTEKAVACTQRRAIPLPKSTDAGRISENARVFWFDITDEDLQRIDELDPLGQSGLDPDTIDF